MTTTTNTQDVTELRRHLFATLDALRDKDNPMAVDRARAVSDVAKTIIDSARVEVEAAKVHKQAPSSNFLQLPSPAAPSPAPGTPPMPPNGITGITRHVLKDD